MTRDKIKGLFAGLIVAISTVALAATFDYFQPATGVLKGNASTYVTTAAASSDIRALWSGSCDATTFLRGDGSCATPAGTTVGANPTGTVGLSAVNGVAATFLRSDGAPALSQAIAPTWTGAHTFSNTVDFNSTTRVSGTSVRDTALFTSGLLPGARGGTNNGFFEVSGPATSTKTFTFPNASATVLTTNAAVTVAQGGTGLTSGTSGGLPYFNSGTTMASSALLAANQIMLGGGAGSAPATLGSLGTTTTVLHGNAAGAPSFGPVTNSDLQNSSITINGTSVALGGTRTLTLASADFANQGTTTTVLHGNASGNPSFGAVGLTTDVTGTLPVTNGGTGLATLAQGDLLYGSAADTLSRLAKDTNASRYLSNTGGSNNPAWAQIDLTNGVTGVLPVANGGTNLNASADDNVMVGNGTTWQTKAVPDCDDTGSNHLNYDTGTNAFTCGTSVSTSGSYTGTLTGCTTSPTITVWWVKTGNIVGINLEGPVTCTSNATTFSITGAPAAILPTASLNSTSGYTHNVTDNGVDFLFANVNMNGSGALVYQLMCVSGTKLTSASCTFTNSGTKGIPAGGSGQGITYSLVPD